MKKFDLEIIVKQAVEKADHPFCDEEDFRIAVVKEIETEYESEELLVITELKYKFFNERTKRIDVFVVLNGKEYAIELKYRVNCSIKNPLKTIELKKSNKSIKITWDIKKLNSDKELPIPSPKDDKGAFITWQKGKTKHKYYILGQTGANECVMDVNKMQDYISKKNPKCIAYTVTLSNHDWYDDDSKKTINFIKSQRNKKIITIKDVNSVKKPKQKDLIHIQKGPHEGFWINIYEIKHK